MKTLIIYDNEGYILTTRQGQPLPREPIGVPFLNVVIPDGKRIKTTDGIGVDVSKTPHEVILEDIPPSELDIMKDKLQSTQDAVDFLILQNMMNGGL